MAAPQQRRGRADGWPPTQGGLYQHQRSNRPPPRGEVVDLLISFFFSQSVPKAFNMDEIEENDLLSDICTDVSTVSTTFASVASLASEADTAERDAAIDDLLEWLEMQPSWGLLE